MSYCSIDKTECYYDAIYRAMKIIQLEKDVKFGDMFNDYILCNQGNPFIIETIDGSLNIKETEGIKSGKYAQLSPLSLISRLVSDRDDLNIEGFSKYKEVTIFHPLLGFENDNGKLGAEILDYNEEKESVVCRYYYVRNRI